MIIISILPVQLFFLTLHSLNSGKNYEKALRKLHSNPYNNLQVKSSKMTYI